MRVMDFSWGACRSYLDLLLNGKWDIDEIVERSGYSKSYHSLLELEKMEIAWRDLEWKRELLCKPEEEFTEKVENVKFWEKPTKKDLEDIVSWVMWGIVEKEDDYVPSRRHIQLCEELDSRRRGDLVCWDKDAGQGWFATPEKVNISKYLDYYWLHKAWEWYLAHK